VEEPKRRQKNGIGQRGRIGQEKASGRNGPGRAKKKKGYRKRNGPVLPGSGGRGGKIKKRTLYYPPATVTHSPQEGPARE